MLPSPVAALRTIEAIKDDTRLYILKYLYTKKNSKNKITYKEILDNFPKRSNFEVAWHISILYSSKLIKNKGYLEDAKFSITPLGIKVFEALKTGRTVEDVFNIKL